MTQAELRSARAEELVKESERLRERLLGVVGRLDDCIAELRGEVERMTGEDPP